jgi:general secretion pathway protein I
MSILTYLKNRGFKDRREGIDTSPFNIKSLPLNIIPSGFTLLEVLVAVAILGAALTVLIGSVNKNLMLASQSKDLVIAGALAQRKLSEIELQGFPEEGEKSGEFEESPGYVWYMSVTPLGLPGLNTEIRMVRLLITWDEGKKDFEVTLAMSNLK